MMGDTSPIILSTASAEVLIAPVVPDIIPAPAISPATRTELRAIFPIVLFAASLPKLEMIFFAAALLIASPVPVAGFIMNSAMKGRDSAVVIPAL